MVDEDEHWSHPNCTSPSSSKYKGLDPSAAQCWSIKILWTLDSCRPRVCRPCYTPEMCCSSIRTAFGAEYGSLPLKGLTHGDNAGRSKDILVKWQHIAISKMLTWYGVGYGWSVLIADMVYDKLSNLEIFLCCQGVEQVNSRQPAARALRKAIGDDRMSGCEESESEFDGDQTVSLGSY